MTLLVRRTARKVALIAIGLFLGAAGVAVAAGQIFVATGELGACAHRETGQLRLSTPADPCRDHEDAVAWNVAGPPGPPGPQGEKGDPGASGTTSLDALAGSPCTIRGKNGATTLSMSTSGFAVQISCLARDDYEPNDSRETAHSFPPSFGLSIAPSIFPAGDEDWFALNGFRSAGWMVNAGDRQLHIELYRNGTLVASETTNSFGFGDPETGSAADWLLHVSGATPTEYSVFITGAFPLP